MTKTQIETLKQSLQDLHTVVRQLKERAQVFQDNLREFDTDGEVSAELFDAACTFELKATLAMNDIEALEGQ